MRHAQSEFVHDADFESDTLAHPHASRGRDFISELCLAVAHRWEPDRYFVIFTAYFDESYHGGTQEMLTMAALLGSTRQWRLMHRRLRALQRRDKFKVFHATEFKKTEGEFADWSINKKHQLVQDLTDAVRGELTEGFSLTLSKQQYLDDYLNKPFPKKMRPESHWGVCFRLTLQKVIERLEHIPNAHKLHVIVEDGHPNGGSAKVIFNKMREEFERRGIHFLGTATLEDKKHCEPLMFADFLAHMTMLMERSGTGLPPYPGDLETPVKGDAGLTFIKVRHGALGQLKTMYETQKAAKHRDYENRKAEYLARKAAL